MYNWSLFLVSSLLPTPPGPLLSVILGPTVLFLVLCMKLEANLSTGIENLFLLLCPYTWS